MNEGLYGGRWVPVRGVMRWVPNKPPRRRHLFDPLALIACPVCKARLTERCRSRSGRCRFPHPSRIVARVCTCGGRLSDPCASVCTGCQRAAYLKPESSVDPVVVERILSGDWRLSCTPAEKTAVCERWAASGRVLNDLARLTHWRIERYYTAERGKRVAS